MSRKLEFNELKEYWYTLSGNINLTFTGFYGEYYEICILNEPKGLFSFFKKLLNSPVSINRKRVNSFSLLLEMKNAFIKYLERLNKKTVHRIEEPNLIDDSKKSNPEFAEYMMTAWDGSQGILLTQWAIDRLNRKKYERPQWVLDKLRVMESDWAAGKLEKPGNFKIDDQGMKKFIRQMQTDGRRQLNLNEFSE